MSKATILLIDDNPTNLEVLLKVLTKSGFKLLIALGGEQALQQIERARTKPDLILLDIMMPGMDGFETCRRLKQQETTKEIPVIFMTALEDTQDKLKGFQVGGVDYITKPLQVKEVLARVETHLVLRNLQKELQEKNAQLQQEISERKKSEQKLRESRSRYFSLFNESPLGMWEDDWSEFKHYVDELKSQGITDFRKYFTKHPQEFMASLSKVKILDLNDTLLKMHNATSKEHFLKNIEQIFTEENLHTLQEAMITLAEGQTQFESEYINKTLDGDKIDIAMKMVVPKGFEETWARILYSAMDITTRKKAEAELENYRHHLEDLVEERTRELTQAVMEAKRLNKQLQQEITDRKRAEELAQKLVTAVETIPLGVTITDLERKIIYVNPADARMHGYTEEELLGQNVDVFAPPELRKPLTEEQIGTMTGWQRESINIRKDGSRFPVNLISEVVRDTHRQIIGIVTTCEDITARKQAEETLKTSEARFRELFNHMNSGVAVYEAVENGQDFVFRDFNQAGERIDGVHKEDIIGKSVLEMFPGVKEFGLLEIFQRVWQTGKPEQHPVSLYQDERIVGWRENEVYKLPSGEIVAVYDDVTERKQAEGALRTSEEQYRRLIENVTDGIGIIQNDRWVFVNDALASMLGVVPDQLLGKAPVDLFHGDVKKQIRMLFEQLQQRDVHAQKTWDVLQCVTTRAGQEVWLEGRYSLIGWERKSAILMSMRDITERKLRELALQEEKEHFRQESLQLRATLGERYRFGDLIGKSAVMQEIYELILKAAATNANVVILGESGTGKEVVARMIHQLSERQKGPFVPVNCAGFTETLFESEFFGYRKGAFTGADKDKPGFFDAAHGGTLFLDEVAELSLIMQAKLLRVIDGSGYTPLGSQAVKHTDVRIVAATNRNLEVQVQQDLLREDFFYRLNVLTITTPPLRDRREDIPLLIDHLLPQYSAGATSTELPRTVIEALLTHNWPGNIRELQNELQHYLSTGCLKFTDLRHAEFRGRGDRSGEEIEQMDMTLTLREAVERFEKRFIARMLNQNLGHRGNTAVRLGLNRKNLYRKMKKYGLLPSYQDTEVE